MKTHAQLPYRQDDYIVLAESDGYTDWVAHAARREDSSREETAAFIVRACNSHYELLAALESCTRYLADLNGSSWINGDDPGSIDMRQRAKALQGIAFSACAKANG